MTERDYDYTETVAGIDEPDYGPETPGYAGIDTFGHDVWTCDCISEHRPGCPSTSDPDGVVVDPEGDLPDWAQDRADKGLCAVIDGWCVTHARAMDPGHWYDQQPAGTNTGD